jgi:hypothetical protein
LTVITVATGAWIAVVYGRTRWTHCRSPEEYERARRHVSGLCEELARRVEKHDAAQHSSEARQWTFMLFLSLVTLVLVAGSPLPDFFGRMAVLCAMGLGLNWLRGHLVNLLRREMEETSPPAD